MRNQIATVVGMGLALSLVPAPGRAQVAAADSDTSVSVQCPASNYGTPVTVEGEVSAPQGDGTDVINYTVDVPPRSGSNTGLWALKGTVKCLVGNSITFTAGGRTDRCSGNKTIVDLTLTPTSTKTGKVTIQSIRPSPQQAPVYTKYSLTFNCNIYRAN